MPDETFTLPTTMPEDFELVFNLWCFTDETGFVHSVAARAYALSGTEEQKLSLLIQLSSTDFMAAKTRKVPPNFSFVTSKGSVSGVVHLDDLKKHTFAVFEPLINDLSVELPTVVRSKGEQWEGVRLGPPKNFLHVLTTVREGKDGSLTAQVA